MNFIRYYLLLLAIAFSFGGFTFYAAVVIPIASDVFDSTSQGFVTQKVTHVINAASCVSLFLLTWDGVALREIRSRKTNRIYFALLVIYSVCLVSLLVLHPRLDAMIDRGSMSVDEPERFYVHHQAYLWLSTVQWVTTFGLVWIVAKSTACSNLTKASGPS